jgi:RAB protein geranylgeranyltransferase component A
MDLQEVKKQLDTYIGYINEYELQLQNEQALKEKDSMNDSFKKFDNIKQLMNL